MTTEHACLICGGPTVYDTVGFGYGSKYDGSFICEACCDQWIDPLVDSIVHNKADSDLFIVRLYDSFDFVWMDVSDPISKEEARRVWDEKTANGTRRTRYEDGDYYAIFPADTRMLFRVRDFDNA